MVSRAITGPSGHVPPLSTLKRISRILAARTTSSWSGRGLRFICRTSLQNSFHVSQETSLGFEFTISRISSSFSKRSITTNARAHHTSLPIQSPRWCALFATGSYPLALRCTLERGLIMKPRPVLLAILLVGIIAFN
ncbi:MAG: hypothetical protein DRP09_18625, partial [Candidatus Thorarchaeota archaeon]